MSIKNMLTYKKKIKIKKRRATPVPFLFYRYSKLELAHPSTSINAALLA